MYASNCGQKGSQFLLVGLTEADNRASIHNPDNLMAGIITPQDVGISISVEVADSGNCPTGPYVRNEIAIDDAKSVH